MANAEISHEKADKADEHGCDYDMRCLANCFILRVVLKSVTSVHAPATLLTPPGASGRLLL